MWHLTACKISVGLSFLNWIKNEMICYHVSELIMPMVRYKSLHFKNDRQTEILQAVRCHTDATFYDCINTIYQFIKLFWENKMSIFEDYGAFKTLCAQ